MGYQLGVDLGTTYTAAAIRRDGVVSVLGLGNRAMQVPSVVCLQPDGSFLVGEAAEARAAAEPDRITREFKRRIGDPVPIIVGGAPFSAEQLTARLLSWVVALATEREGAPPDSVTVSYPANWGAYKTDLLRQMFALANLRDVRTCTEPVAAAITYATRHRVPPGGCVAVYDLGGGTFDAAVLREADGEFSIVGEPEGIEHLGGVDFDEAVFQHVLGVIGQQLSGVDADDPAVMRGLGRLRRDCVAAKESLSTNTEAVIAVNVGGVDTVVRLTRSEFEDLVRPAIDETIASMRRVLHSADVPPEQLDAIVLVGGSSRIPLVSEMLSGEFGRPLALDAHPKHDIAIGAAWFGAPLSARARDIPPEVATDLSTAPDDATAPLDPVRGKPGGKRWGMTTAASADGRHGPWRSRWIVAGAGGVAVVVAVTAAVWLGGGSGKHHNTGSSGGPTGTASGSSTPQRPTGPALPDNVVLWVAPRNGVNQIWTADTSGRDQKAIVANADRPVISHDRQTIAYVDDAGLVVRLVGTDGRNSRPLFSSPPAACPRAVRPAFSPDNTQLVMLCWQPPFSRTSWALYLVDVDGKNLRGPLDTGRLGNPTFSPDGTRIAYWKAGTVDGKPNQAIFEVNTSGTPAPQRISGWTNASEPAYSPTGSALVLSIQQGQSGREIAVLDLTTKKTTVLTANRKPIDDSDPSWSPNGKQIAYQHGTSAHTDIWVMNADGSDQHAMISNSQPHTFFAWSAR
jgi:actin-like ATPase involved in cell morphogenesis